MMKKWCSRVNGITTISSTDQSKSHQYYKYVMWWCDDGVMMANNNRCDGVVLHKNIGHRKVVMAFTCVINCKRVNFAFR